MKIEDLKVGTKLQVIKTYRMNGITFKEGEIILIKEKCSFGFGETFSIKSQCYNYNIVASPDFLLNYCKVITPNIETKTNKPLYEVEVKLNFKNRRYTIGDFVRVKVDGDNYYGKIKEINTTTIQLAKLSSKGKYTIELDGIAEMENIG
ncbi:hypothetical protein ACRTAL_002288 [Clostridium perfringens]